MGKPGSETDLEEFICRVVGEHIQAGLVSKLADDLYCGGNSPDKLLEKLDQGIKSSAAQTKLRDNKEINLPNSDDCLWIVTDRSVSRHDIGITLYITRDGKIILAGFVCSKLHNCQKNLSSMRN